MAVFAGIDPHHGGDGDHDIQGATGKAGVEDDLVVANDQLTHGAGAEIEHDLPILDELGGDHRRGAAGIHQQVGGHVVIQDPVVQSTDQVRAIGGHVRLLQTRPRPTGPGPNVKVWPSRAAFPVRFPSGCAGRTADRRSASCTGGWRWRWAGSPPPESAAATGGARCNNRPGKTRRS